MVFIPLHDNNPLKRIRYQYVTASLVLINVAVYLFFQSGWVFSPVTDNVMALALVPQRLFDSTTWLGGGAERAALSIVSVPERFTLLTYMFLHGSWLHLLGNMLFLWVFGDNVEDAMGHVRFILFYLMCGIAAGVAHAVMLPHSEAPMIGASGAIAGIIAAYLILHPRAKVWVLALWRIPIKISAFWALGFWILFQVANLVIDKNSDVAWWAHAGGLTAGALLILFMRRPGVPLLGRERGRRHTAAYGLSIHEPSVREPVVQEPVVHGSAVHETSVHEQAAHGPASEPASPEAAESGRSID